MGEVNLYGVYVPILLLQAILAYVLLLLCMPVLHACVERDWIAMPSIFYLCVYLILLWGVHWVCIQNFL